MNGYYFPSILSWLGSPGIHPRQHKDGAQVGRVASSSVGKYTHYHALRDTNYPNGMSLAAAEITVYPCDTGGICELHIDRMEAGGIGNSAVQEGTTATLM